MRKAIGAALAVALALALPACGSIIKGEARIGNKASEVPSVERVMVLLDIFSEEKTETWLLEKGISHADAVELIAKAKKAIREKQAKCAGLDDCAS